MRDAVLSLPARLSALLCCECGFQCVTPNRRSAAVPFVFPAERVVLSWPCRQIAKEGEGGGPGGLEGALKSLPVRGRIASVISPSEGLTPLTEKV